MKPSEVKRAVKTLISINRPAWIAGSPGISKSSVVKQVAKELDMGLIEIRAALIDSVDLSGIPAVKNGETVWSRPAVFPYADRADGKRGIIFLDELPQAAASVQGAFSQAVLDHKIGEHALDPNWVFVVAGNNLGDRAATFRSPSFLLNRFTHVEMDVSVDDWMAWAEGAGIAPEVRAFIKFKPGLLSNFEADKSAKAFASPRSWEFASQIVGATRGDPLGFIRGLVVGTVGEGPGNEFVSFLQIWRDLPDVDKMLENPTTCDIPVGVPSVVHAMIGALSSRLENKRGDKDLLGRFIAIGKRLPAEWATLARVAAVAADSHIMRHEDFRGWVGEMRASGMLTLD